MAAAVAVAAGCAGARRVQLSVGLCCAKTGKTVWEGLAGRPYAAFASPAYGGGAKR